MSKAQVQRLRGIGHLNFAKAVMLVRLTARYLARHVACALLVMLMPAQCANADGVTYWYDDVGRLKRVMDEQGSIRSYNYDAVGNILSIEAGDGGCPAAAPTVASITPNTCKAGTTCEITVTGGSLLGGTLTSSLIDAPVSQCHEVACDTITCRLSPSPFMAPGPVTVRVTTPLGFDEGAVQIDPPPSLGQPGQAETWHFAANAGAVVTLRMTRLVNQQDGSSSLDPMVELRDSRGFLLAQDDDSGSDLPPGPGRNAVVQNFTLPATDTYVLIARAKAGTSGTYILEIEPNSVMLLPGEPEPTQPPGFVFDGTISARPIQANPALTFQGAIATPPQRDTHTFPANVDTVVSVQVNRVANQANGSGTLDPSVELRDSRDFLLRQDTDSGTNLPPGPGQNALILNYRLPTTDTYRIIVKAAGDRTGPYEVKVFLGSMSVETESDTFTFPASSGQFATVVASRVASNLDGSGSLDPQVELRDSRGFLLGRDDDSGTNQPRGPGRNAVIAHIFLPATDTYSLTVRAKSGTLGPYRMEVSLEN